MPLLQEKTSSFVNLQGGGSRQLGGGGRFTAALWGGGGVMAAFCVSQAVSCVAHKYRMFCCIGNWALQKPEFRGCAEALYTHGTSCSRQLQQVTVTPGQPKV